MRLTGEIENRVTNTDTTEDKKTTYELTDEDLEGIAGGGSRNPAEQKGYVCPVCKFDFHVSLFRAMLESRIICPYCTTTFAVDFPKKDLTSIFASLED